MNLGAGVIDYSHARCRTFALVLRLSRAMCPAGTDRGGAEMAVSAHRLAPLARLRELTRVPLHHGLIGTGGILWLEWSGVRRR